MERASYIIDGNLLVAEAVSSNEKEVPKEIIFEAIDTAFAITWPSVSIIRKKSIYMLKLTIRQVIISLFPQNMAYIARNGTEIKNPVAELILSQARECDSKAVIGVDIEEQIPSAEFGRIEAQTAKQVIIQKARMPS